SSTSARPSVSRSWTLPGSSSRSFMPFSAKLRTNCSMREAAITAPSSAHRAPMKFATYDSSPVHRGNLPGRPAWRLAVAGSLAQKEQRDARDMTASSGKESGTEGGPHRAGDRATAWRALRERKERARKESGPADGSRSRFYAGRKAAVKVVNRVRGKEQTKDRKSVV